jgi:hypothetical protein
MTDQTRESGAILEPEAAPPGRPGLPATADDEGVGYARADLRDALARIRDAAGPRSVDVGDRGRSTERTADDRILIEEVTALGARVDRLVELVESARESGASALAATKTVEDRLAGLSVRSQEAQATQARANARLFGLSVALVVLTVIVLALLLVEIAQGVSG